jgi:predicted dehydrogenase
LSKPFGVGIVGCGLIGRKRANALGAGGRLVACMDLDSSKAEKLALDHGCEFLSNWKELISRKDVELVIVSTLHDSLAEITQAAIIAGKHVLVEKPAARKAEELEPLLELKRQLEVKVRVGFNHRYHRSLRKAKELFDSKVLGEMMFIRGRYGHGGRVGYDREWRSKPDLSGGGELIDQGPHMIDLSRMFLGDFVEYQGYAHTYFWDMPVDDNGFMLLKTAKHQTAFLHVSCTEWKNLFSMEIYGKKGKLELFGLGGSYGTEKIIWYKMLPEMGPPETICWEFPMGDDSWEFEMNEFYKDILLDREPEAGLVDAVAALKIIEKIYMDSGYDHRS